MRLRLVAGAGANVFLREILEAIAFEAAALGVDAAVVDKPDGDDPGTAYVVMPHEYFVIVPEVSWLGPDQLRRTLALNVEHPGTPWFELAAQQAARCARVFDINDDSAHELARYGLDVARFEIGASRYWSRWDGQDGERPHDIVYLGASEPRRDAHLAEYARDWWDLDTRLHLTTDAPRSARTPGFLTGENKFALLARSKVLVNLHRTDSRALEWVRVMEAMANGCVVVSEHSLDAAPLVPGVHFLSTHPDRVGAAARALAQDPERLAAMRRAGVALLERMPLARSVERLIAAATDVLARPAPSPAERAGTPVPVPPRPGRRPVPWAGPRDRTDALGAAVARIERMLTRERQERELERLGAATLREAQQVVATTPAFDEARPRVSVIVPLYRHGALLPEALDSVRATTGVAYEVLIQDDGSPDDSLDATRRYLAAHPDLPARLVASRVNHGVCATRNLLLERARGEYVLPLDADNGLFPPALAELVAALDSAPTAPFAYAPIITLRAGAATGFVSAHPWDPEQLRYGNYIDTMALLRTSDMRAMGGWDEHLTLWEDFHLWLRFAEAGRTPVFLPRALAWYRLTGHSLRMAGGHDDRTLWSRMHEAAPNLFRDLLLER